MIWRGDKLSHCGAAPEGGAIPHHLGARVLRDRDNQKLLDVIGWHHDRCNRLRFLFLDDPSIEPTNNRAERALRSAVIARPDYVGVSQCSKNEAGVYAFSAFTSVLQPRLERDAGTVLEAL